MQPLSPACLLGFVGSWLAWKGAQAWLPSPAGIAQAVHGRSPALAFWAPSELVLAAHQLPGAGCFTKRVFRACLQPPHSSAPYPLISQPSNT